MQGTGLSKMPGCTATQQLAHLGCSKVDTHKARTVSPGQPWRQDTERLGPPAPPPFPHPTPTPQSATLAVTCSSVSVRSSSSCCEALSSRSALSSLQQQGRTHRWRGGQGRSRCA